MEIPEVNWEHRHFVRNAEARAFLNLTRDLSARDWMMLLVGELPSKVYVYDADARAAVLASELDDQVVLPWPITWLLGAHHRKHIFAPKRLPSIRGISDALTSVHDRVAWMWSFHSGKIASSAEKPTKFVKRKEITPCNVEMPGELRAWSSKLVEAVLDRCKQTLDAASTSQRQWWRTEPMLVRQALGMLRRSDLAVRLSDKDGCFTIATRQHILQARQAAMPPSKYSIVSTLQVKPHSLQDLYHNITLRIAKACEDSSLVRRLRIRIPCDEIDDLTSPIIENVKTHKAEGNVSCRVIHSTARFPFNPLGMWAASVMKEQLSKVKHIATSTSDVIKAIKSVDLEPGDMLLKADVAQFYMSGDHHRLAKYTSQFVPSHLRDVMFDAVLFILDNQYVDHEPDLRQVKKVSLGAGMGLNLSGEVADIAFLLEREATFIFDDARCLTFDPETVRKYGIKTYVRYKDDVFAVLRKAPCRAEFAAAWDKKCPTSCFVIEEIECSGSHVCMVDLFVYKAVGCTKLRYCTHFKDSSLGIQLSHDSAHHHAVHKWIHAENFRLARNSDDEVSYVNAKAVMMNRLRSAFYCPVRLARLQQENALSILRSRKRSKMKDEPVSRLSSIWLALPHHSIWVRCQLGAFIRAKLMEPEMRMLWDFVRQGLRCEQLDMPTVSIAWRNSVPHLFSILRKG